MTLQRAGTLPGEHGGAGSHGVGEDEPAPEGMRLAQLALPLLVVALDGPALGRAGELGPVVWLWESWWDNLLR